VKVAMMGTRGVPAQYGGFETAVEEVGRRLVERGHEVTVYARNPGQQLGEYLGMRVVNAPAIRHRFAETLSHTALSTAHAMVRDRPDVCLLLNAGNAPFLPVLRSARIPTAIHLDGLESQREKWRGAGARYYRWAEGAAIRWADEVIADSDAISDYVSRTYGRDCVTIAYGAEVISPPSDRLAELSLEPGEYHLIVARLEPENHVLDAVHAYRVSGEHRPLIVVGAAPYSQWYIDRVTAVADERIRLVGGIYDKELLDQLYAHARSYIHGHSVGGTNPSLLRAMGAGAPVLAFDVVFNREVTADKAFFWSDADQLTELLNLFGEDLSALRIHVDAGVQRIAEHYQWDQVAAAYEELMNSLVAKRGRR
jgi:glycosyltransferase involved in cell wall biosynthesis